MRRGPPVCAEDSLPTDSPNPHPARAVYGFGLLLVCLTLFTVFTAWALLPDWLLTRLHLCYLPAKFWAVAVPLLLPLLTLLYCLFHFAYSIHFFHDCLASVRTVENDFRH